jgi:hypothetical protein
MKKPNSHVIADAAAAVHSAHAAVEQAERTLQEAQEVLQTARAAEAAHERIFPGSTRWKERPGPDRPQRGRSR